MVMARRIVGLFVALSLLELAAPEQVSAQSGLTELIRMAEQGDAVAECNLGFSYAYGTGVPQDDALALAWYRRAAEQGLAAAQHHLGVMYANGEARHRTSPKRSRGCAGQRPRIIPTRATTLA